MENDKKVQSWGLGEPISADMLEMEGQSFVIWEGSSPLKNWVDFIFTLLMDGLK